MGNASSLKPRGKVMKKFFARFLGRLVKRLEEEPMKVEQPQEIINITQPEAALVFLPKVESVSGEAKKQAIHRCYGI